MNNWNKDEQKTESNTMVERTDKLTQTRARNRKTNKTDSRLEKGEKKTEGAEDRQKPKVDKTNETKGQMKQG